MGHTLYGHFFSTMVADISIGTDWSGYILNHILCDMDEYALVDISRILKNQDSRLVTNADIFVIPILSTNFVFKNENSGCVYGFVEVKVAGVSLKGTCQALG